MKKSILFFLCSILLVSCNSMTDSSQNLSQGNSSGNTSSPHSSSQKIQEEIIPSESNFQKPDFNTVSKSDILVRPYISDAKNLSFENFGIYLDWGHMHSPETLTPEKRGYPIGIFANLKPLSQADIALQTSVDVSKFQQGIRNAHTEVTGNFVFYKTPHVHLYDKRNNTTQDLPDMYDVSLSGGALVSSVHVDVTDKEEISKDVDRELSLTQFDALGRTQDPERIFVDFSSVRDFVDSNHITIAFLPKKLSQNAFTFPKITLITKDGKKQEVSKKVMLSVPLPNPSRTLYSCYEEKCLVDIMKDDYKNLDLIEISYKDK